MQTVYIQLTFACIVCSLLNKESVMCVRVQVMRRVVKLTVEKSWENRWIWGRTIETWVFRCQINGTGKSSIEAVYKRKSIIFFSRNSKFFNVSKCLGFKGCHLLGAAASEAVSGKKLNKLIKAVWFRAGMSLEMLELIVVRGMLHEVHNIMNTTAHPLSGVLVNNKVSSVGGFFRSAATLICRVFLFDTMFFY